MEGTGETQVLIDLQRKLGNLKATRKYLKEEKQDLSGITEEIENLAAKLAAMVPDIPEGVPPAGGTGDRSFLSSRSPYYNEEATLAAALVASAQSQAALEPAPAPQPQPEPEPQPYYQRQPQPQPQPQPEPEPQYQYQPQPQPGPQPQ